jgi:hypothetical protein
MPGEREIEAQIFVLCDIVAIRPDFLTALAGARKVPDSEGL